MENGELNMNLQHEDRVMIDSEMKVENERQRESTPRYLNRKTSHSIPEYSTIVDDFPQDTIESSSIPNSIDINEKQNSIQEIAKKIFSSPQLNWTPEARITYRINAHKAKIAELKGEQFIPETIKRVRERYIKTKGIDFWNNALIREKEILIAEKINLKKRYE